MRGLKRHFRTLLTDTALSPTGTPPRVNRGQADAAPLELRRLREGIVTLQASNDAVRDRYGTIITVESLHDWWRGFREHRTLNLQHDLPELRGIKGKPMVGVVIRVDFAPQLIVTARVFDDDVNRLIDERKITSGSLEFVPLDEERRMFAGEDTAFFYRLSTEPEHCGLSLVDIPGVPGTDILEVRSMMPSWTFAVVDPKVLSGEVSDPQLIAQLRWLPHHDIASRMVDEAALQEAIEGLTTITVPPESSLTREQVVERARAHLERHSSLGIGMPVSQGTLRITPQGDKEETPVGKVQQWLQARASMYVAEGMSQQEAERKAQADMTPQLRAKLEGAEQQEAEPRGLLGRAAASIVNIYTGGGRQYRADQAPNTPDDEEAEEEDGEEEGNGQQQGNSQQQNQGQQQGQQGQQGQQPNQQPNQQQPQQGNQQQGQQGDLEQRIDARISAALARPEDPMAAMGGSGRARERLRGDELLSRVLAATLVPQMQRRAVDANEVQRVHNMLSAHGISSRALTIESNGTVIREELARQFVIQPYPSAIGRNLFRSVPMQGTKKVDFPRFDRQGVSYQWNRSSTVGPGSTTYIDESDPTLDTFPLEVTELNAAVRVPDSFLEFNAAGVMFVNQTLLPQLREGAQLEEDREFFLSTGVHPRPNTWQGLDVDNDVTLVVPAANGDTFNLELLSSLLRAMPKNYRTNRRRLAYFLPSGLCDDFETIISNRQSVLGDAYLTGDRAGDAELAPVGFYRRIPIYEAVHKPEDQVQGSSSDASTITLTHLDIPVIGDALTLRFEPWRDRGMQAVLQLQEFVGLGKQWPTAIVRRPGVRPAAS